MLDAFGKRVFVLAVLLIVVVYWFGSVNVLNSVGSNFVKADNVVTGRNADGSFGNYPR